MERSKTSAITLGGKQVTLLKSNISLKDIVNRVMSNEFEKPDKQNYELFIARLNRLIKNEEDPDIKHVKRLTQYFTSIFPKEVSKNEEVSKDEASSKYKESQIVENLRTICNLAKEGSNEAFITLNRMAKKWVEKPPEDLVAITTLLYDALSSRSAHERVFHSIFYLMCEMTELQQVQERLHAILILWIC